MKFILLNQNKLSRFNLFSCDVLKKSKNLSSNSGIKFLYNKKNRNNYFLFSAYIALFLGSFISFSQTTLLTENFSSATVPGLPIGWTATSATNTWVSNNVNQSTGAYTGASGGNYLVVFNTATTPFSNVFDLTYNNNLSTVGYTSIKVSYGARRSASQAADAVLQYSTNGTLWTTVTVTNVTGTGGIWTLANGDRNSYELPAAAAGVTNLQLRWKFTQSSTTSTANYSIDDVVVQGITSGQYWTEGDGDYRSAVASGTWSSSNTWQVRTSGVWATATTTPTSANNVYIQSGHAITVNTNASCRDLHFNTTTTVASITVADGITLQVNRKIRAYTGTTTVTTGNDAAFYTTVSVTNGNPTIVTTLTGKISFVNPGPITYSGEWGANTTIWNAEFAIPAGQTATLGTSFKAGNINIVSGTLSPGGNDLRPDNGSTGGSLTVAEGAKLLFNNNGNIIRTSSTHCSSVTINGTLEYSSSAIGTIAASTINFNGDVIYSQNTQTLVTKGSITAASNPTTYNNLIFSGGSSTTAKTITLPTTVNGKLSFACHATHGITFSGTGALMYGPNATLEYAMTNTTRRVINPEWPATSGPKNVTFLSTNAACGLTLTSNVGGTTLNSLTVGLNTVLDSAGFTITLNGATPSASVLGKFRTNNTNGLSGTSSSSILNTNNPTVTLGNASTIEYYAASTATSQTITNRSDYFNVSLFGTDNNKTFTGSTNIAGTLLLSITGTSTLTGMANVTMSNNSTIIRNSGVLNAAPIYGSDVTVTYGGTNVVDSGFELTPAAGTISALNITSGQYNLSSNYTVNTGKTLTISGTGTLSINSGKTLTISGTADFAGKSVTIKSDATGTGSIGQITGTLTGATNVTVERYIPAKRAWRALTTPLKGSEASIFSQWQNNGTISSGVGVELWGPAGDASPSSSNSGLAFGPNSSILQYNNAGSGAWSAVTNTNSTKLFTTTGNNAFMIFPTGGYGSGNISNSTAAVATTLKATGQLITGQVDYLNLPSASHTLIGNPYASPIDIATMLGSNADFNGNVWVWDANAAGVNTVGTYNLFDSGTYTNLTNDTAITSGTQIQSGQAFFVKPLTNLSTFTIQEAHKGSVFSNAVFRNATPSETLRIGLYKQTNNQWSGRDGAMAVFFTGANANQMPNKMANGSENIAFTKNGILFASEHHLPLVASDVLNVRVWNTTAGANYKLKINTEQFATTNLNATLVDLFTNSRTPIALNGTAVEYPFAVTTEAASTGNRFQIIFETNALGINNPKTVGITVLPNPIIGDAFQVNLGTLEMGTYSYSICNALGQEVEKGGIYKASQNENYGIRLKNNTAAGMYIIKVTDTDNNVFTAKLIKQ